MTDDIIIRTATVQDIPFIRKIAEVTWHDTYDSLIPRAIQDKFIGNAYSDETLQLKVHKTHLLVAEVNGEVAGFANFFVRDSYAELGAIYIYPHEQGKGTGSKLLEAGLPFLERERVSQLSVEVEKGNEAGENFYEAKGFELLEEYDENLYGHILKTKRMVLKL